MSGRLVSGYILSGLDPLSGGSHGSDQQQQQCGEQSQEAADWSLETLQAYLAHVRTLRPQPDREAVTVLQTYYQVLTGNVHQLQSVLCNLQLYGNTV